MITMHDDYDRECRLAVRSQTEIAQGMNHHNMVFSSVFASTDKPHVIRSYNVNLALLCWWCWHNTEPD